MMHPTRLSAIEQTKALRMFQVWKTFRTVKGITMADAARTHKLGYQQAVNYIKHCDELWKLGQHLDEATKQDVVTFGDRTIIAFDGWKSNTTQHIPDAPTAGEAESLQVCIDVNSPSNYNKLNGTYNRVQGLGNSVANLRDPLGYGILVCQHRRDESGTPSAST